MSHRPPPRYFYSRLSLYGIVLFLLGWIAVSMILSVGVSVFWEYERGAVFPKSGPERIVSAESASQATDGLLIFNRELLANVKRFLSHYRQDPEQTAEIWNVWRAEWRQDLLTFGSMYALTTPQSPPNAEAARLADLYRDLLELERAYALSFESIYRINEDKHLVLTHRLEALKATLDARLQP